MSSSASDSAAGYAIVNQTFPIRFLVSVSLFSTFYTLATIRSHKHIHDVTTLLFIAIFWINYY